MPVGTVEQALSAAIDKQRQGRFGEALAICEQILAVHPEHPSASRLAGALRIQLELVAARAQRRGDPAQTLAAIERVCRAHPDSAEAHHEAAFVLSEAGRSDEAMARLDRSLELSPTRFAAWNDRGNLLRRLERPVEAAASYERGLELAPGSPELLRNLGNLHFDLGELDAAIACYRQSIAQGGGAAAGSNLLYALQFHPGATREGLAEEHRRWDARWAAHLATGRPARSPKPRLRIGYVSPNLRTHPVGLFMEPVLAQHDHDALEIFCYDDAPLPDHVTARLRRHADVWRRTGSLDDAELAALVRSDAIDVLVDLTAHMGRNRLLTFARRPAPVQVTYLAYAASTGLGALDFRLSDARLDPPERPGDGPERIWHLPSGYWCYQPPDGAPRVGDCPSLRDGSVTFACLNNFSKVGAPVVEAWARVLATLPQARLVLLVPGGESCPPALRARLEAAGLPRERLQLVGRVAPSSYHAAYGDVDIALDPFPYGGGTTTLDALWMGVPVVTLAGDRGVGRGGLTILDALELRELVASSADEYVRIAVELARDQPRRQELRATLRARLGRSRLCDAAAFTRGLEAAYRAMVAAVSPA